MMVLNLFGLVLTVKLKLIISGMFCFGGGRKKKKTSRSINQSWPMIRLLHRWRTDRVLVRFFWGELWMGID